MKAIIRVSRRTEYASIVEMSQEKYDELNAALDGNRAERKEAEKILNDMIDTDDWQDDELICVTEFGEDADESA